MKLTIIDIAQHRNGIGGAPFATVLFEDSGPEGSRKIAILFEAEYHCAVLDVAKLAAGDIAFGSNSWRGDTYEALVRAETTARLGTETLSLDIHDLLRERRQIAHIWSVEDVQSIRPDLSEEQAWEVLRDVDHHKDAELGITWLTLEMAAEHLYGAAAGTDESGEA
jgi:hypothetical protein